MLNIFTYTENNPLLFTNIQFWVFFTLLLVGYIFIYKRTSARSLYLLIFSLFFYYKSSGLFFILLLFATSTNFLIGLLIPKRKKNGKKWLVALGVATNLLLLSYFKYSYLIIDTINAIFGSQLEVINYLAIWANNMGGRFSVDEIVLPVGISFYLFQTTSYIVDVYRQKLTPVRSFVDFAFYVSFFPQLVAGPIVRATEFMPQVYQKYSLTVREFGHATFLIVAGLLKKIVISDYISINFVDRVFDNPLIFSGFENLMAVYGYALQIYCDFSGYTDIAIGLALLLGFKLCINFNSPYKATSITDFWRRWHISLSTWLRDYLYIPLGGNRKGKFRTYLNLMITMLLGGLWHGANLRFVIWGGIHGIGLVIDKAAAKVLKVNHKNRWRKLIGAIITFNMVCFAWIFFRAGNMEAVGNMLNQIFTRFGAEAIPEIATSYSNIFALMVAGFALHWLPHSFKERIRGTYIESNMVIKFIIIFAAIIIIVQFKSSSIQPFIYFRF